MKCEYCGDEVVNKLNGPYCCTDHKEIMFLRRRIKELGDIALRPNTSKDSFVYNSEYTVDFTTPTQYTIDLDKVFNNDDVNAKVNAIFAIFKGLNITIQDHAMSEELCKFTTQM